CLFSLPNDATWGPIVYFDEDKSKGAFYNYGACYGALAGGPCGETVQQWNFCMADICGACATDAAYGACQQKAANTCGRFDYTTTCAGNLDLLNQACDTLTEALSAVCGR